jgi:hypothetical protein
MDANEREAGTGKLKIRAFFSRLSIGGSRRFLRPEIYSRPFAFIRGFHRMGLAKAIRGV